MALESKMLPLGTIAPEFNLPDVVTKKTFSLNTKNTNFEGTVIMFICNHCKYVKHINTKLIETALKFQKLGLQFIGISSNDVSAFPEDSPENMKKVAAELDYPFPYLYDESQEVAKAYEAACTPDFYIFNKGFKLVYRGRFDGSTPGNGVPVTGNDLNGALRALVAKDFVSEIQYPSMGCGIKWKGM